jgi:hypothetical protein
MLVNCKDLEESDNSLFKDTPQHFAVWRRLRKTTKRISV